MDISSIYLLVAIVAFLIIVLGLIFIKKTKQKPSNLVNAALIILIFSMFFEERLIAYPLIGLAIALSIIDIFLNKKIK